MLPVLWDQSFIAAWRPAGIRYCATSNDMDTRGDAMRRSRATTIVGDIPRIRLGYGDILAVHRVARSLAMVESLTRQLYPAILIARLFSMEIASKGSQPG